MKQKFADRQNDRLLNLTTNRPTELLIYTPSLQGYKNSILQQVSKPVCEYESVQT